MSDSGAGAGNIHNDPGGFYNTKKKESAQKIK